VPATAQLAALPPIRIIRTPGRPVMVILPLPPAPPKPPPTPPDTRPVIVLDPGHGGVDPGATGLSGVHEKAITLAFATELQHQLEDSGRYRVLLTRTDDSAVALRERVRIARAAHADLFLSIHADTLANRAISGLSVYTESETASDRETEALASKENKADLIAGIDLSGAAPELTSILIDLAQRETRNRSSLLAGELVEALGGVAALLPRAHRSAGFAVLTAPDVPSVLLELGYLSNKADERGLTSPEHRSRLAGRILAAIDEFFAAHPMLQRS
jgi:N-acetylmuramoyl-L-alanine amidase